MLESASYKLVKPSRQGGMKSRKPAPCWQYAALAEHERWLRSSNESHARAQFWGKDQVAFKPIEVEVQTKRHPEREQQCR